ncbi:MAG: Gfo/Idh/MocA family oxidoreductase [Gemmatimonadaceae bacterium]|nr:Gfo/Idh/MocA family oxidoreductase [Gemmatimonadaceae bacterium]MDQ3519951.1 Gfo/Idh/MocA family oxidoreductase [Gemmatimonadota bacterium]
MKQAVRFGIVGVGAITQVAHLPVLSKMRGAQVVALCDNDGLKARSLADRFEVPDVFTDMQDLLELDEVDAVIVGTPNHLHEPHVLSALAAGVDVLCERPLSLTVKGVERILTAAQRAGRKVAVANNHRFRSDVHALSGFLRGGELGHLTGVRAGAYQPRRAQEGWRFRRAEAGGGTFLEHGFPLLDLALWLADFPDPIRVTAHMQRGKGASAVEDSMLVNLECAQGIVFAFDVSWAYVGMAERWWFEVLASRGGAQLGPLRVVKELNAKPMDVSPTGAAARESAFTQSYRAELAHFLAVLRDEASYEPPTDQVIVHRIMEAIYRSAEEGKEVRL